MMRLPSRSLGILVVFFLTGSHLHADTLGLDFVNTSTTCCFGAAAGENAVGWAFTTSIPYYVTALGLFDYESDGLQEAAPVTLWKSGSAIATATISNSSTPLAAMESRGRWLFESITPVLISPGDYVMGVYYASDSPQDRGAFDFVDNSTRIQPITASGITYGGYRFNNGGQYPGGGFPTDDGFFGPNLLVVAVPEPGVLTLSFGLMMAITLHRRGMQFVRLRAKHG